MLRFERAYNFVRVNVTASQIEVAALRVDGTLIETTTWRDEPEKLGALVPAAAPTTLVPASVPAAGAPTTATAPVSAPGTRSPLSTPGSSGLNHWLLLGGLGALGAAVVVVRALRRT